MLGQGRLLQVRDGSRAGMSAWISMRDRTWAIISMASALLSPEVGSSCMKEDKAQCSIEQRSTQRVRIRKRV